MKITMAHGSGGVATEELIREVFARRFNNEYLSAMEDAAVLPEGEGRITLTTDSFVVDPVFFPGGDIGMLAVCGTINDILMSGAVPRYLTCSFILEEGLGLHELDKLVSSMADAADRANVKIVAGDTKVIGGTGGVLINTTGLGFLPEGRTVSPKRCAPGDVLLLSGNLGDHHAAILSARLGVKNNIKSDAALLVEPVKALFDAGVDVKAMRDITRGGLATILNEFAASSGCGMEILEEDIPVSPAVRAFCGVLGLDPLYMGNEGKMIVAVNAKDKEKALSVLRATKLGKDAAAIGKVLKEKGVTLKTRVGGRRVLNVLYGEGLPRIC
jgi:hydrogenase expression/formation protein HypE